MSQLLATMLSTGGGVAVVGVVLLLKVLLGDRRADRRIEGYIHSLEVQIRDQGDRIRVLEAWKEAASNTITSAGLPLPTVIAVPTPHTATDRS
ncbi:MAG: hypothetical protein BGO38_07885 [Cellulomonas sp. 73-145]|uniref:hypothetical protein n=1 Tax=Cellulomonas sp. 73-145 TaxID=1895739 RepID=UPI00092BDA45|nr:hypothetical protein [Cellulomonas sp. 73-145]MBN9327731.1 hypothetical protein [Cellulomonas sp.]OJV58112.1 MAG: hypothetical protein BGO38_07885 [Cellulomonas sp. 73-145]